VARLDELTANGVHQGVLVRLRAIEPVDLDAVARKAGEASLVLLLDRITDPQNLGAVLRTAVAVGVDAVVLPLRRGALLTPGVHRQRGHQLHRPVAAPQNLAGHPYAQGSGLLGRRRRRGRAPGPLRASTGPARPHPGQRRGGRRPSPPPQSDCGGPQWTPGSIRSTSASPAGRSPTSGVVSGSPGRRANR
jgi:hypothetical protein